MICPVCLRQDIGASGGVVDTHADTMGGGICPMSGKPAFAWAESSTRQAVPTRSGGRCEYCGVRARECHHRKPRSQGGPWSPANILHLCSACHRYFTEHPTLAYGLGVSVHRDQDPAEIPVRTADGALLWLSDAIAPPLPGWAR